MVEQQQQQQQPVIVEVHQAGAAGGAGGAAKEQVKPVIAHSLPAPPAGALTARHLARALRRTTGSHSRRISGAKSMPGEHEQRESPYT